MQNPVTPVVYHMLEHAPTGFSLLELIKACDERCLFDDLKIDSNEMLLFYKNFFAMNALFTVQDQLYEDKIALLSIESIRCTLTPITESDTTALAHPTQDAKLKAYYQDWSSLTEITLDGVHQLLNQFWEKYLAVDEVELNCQRLEMTPDQMCQTHVKRQFRTLAQTHHPDRGGDSGEFIKLRKAYESLMRVCDN